MRSVPLVLVALAAVASVAPRPVAADPRPPARNLIVLVADGAGYNTWLAAGHYLGTGHASFRDTPGWVEVACATYALREERPADLPTGTRLSELQDRELVYDPTQAWSRVPVEGGSETYPYFYESYRWLLRAPDSANTATALASGVSTYRGAINVDVFGRPIEPTLPSLARRGGRRTGIVTSVPLSHATPAALGGAHASHRRLYCSIARELLTSGRLDVIVGCGDGDSDDDGNPHPGSTDAETAAYVGGEELWAHLTGRVRLEPHDPVAVAYPDEAWEATAADIAALDAWTLVRDREEIERLQVGDTPERLLVVPRVAATLQADRSSSGDPQWTTVGEDPRLPDVPDLATLTRVALNALDDDPDGFYLCVEGGAIDWAMHGNAAGRMIEETLDFLAAVEAVVDWVERESSWGETLVVVTSDHDHLLAGPRAGEVPFDPLVDRGPGEVPGHRWLSDRHSNALVRLLARGVDAGRFDATTRVLDPVRGRYLHQVDAHRVMAGAMLPAPQPAEAAFVDALRGSARVVGLGRFPQGAGHDALLADLATSPALADVCDAMLVDFVDASRQAELDAFVDGDGVAADVSADAGARGFLDALRAAREARPGAPVIRIVAAGSEDDRNASLVRAVDAELLGAGRRGIVVASPDALRRGCAAPDEAPRAQPRPGEWLARALPDDYLAVLPWAGAAPATEAVAVSEAWAWPPGTLVFTAGSAFAGLDAGELHREDWPGEDDAASWTGTELGRMWDAVLWWGR